MSYERHPQGEGSKSTENLSQTTTLFLFLPGSNVSVLTSAERLTPLLTDHSAWVSSLIAADHAIYLGLGLLHVVLRKSNTGAYIGVVFLASIVLYCTHHRGIELLKYY